MKVIIDIASVAKATLFAGQDKEQGYYEYDPGTGKEVLINSAAYGLQNLTRSFVKFMELTETNPCQMVLINDGENALHRRKSISPLYKDRRHKSEGFRREYAAMLSQFQNEMLSLGAQTAEVAGFEADDLIAYFAKTIRQDAILIWSNDHDMLKLVSENVTVYSNGEFNPKPYGEFPYEFIDLYKATVGDTSDNIKGAKGFGTAAFMQVYRTFGDRGMRTLRHLIQDRKLAALMEDVEKVPQLQKLIDYAPDVETSLKLATLLDGEIRMEKIQWRHGINKGETTIPQFLPWAQQVLGVTADNFEQVKLEIEAMVSDLETVVLDIETSTPEESDNWLYTLKGKEADKSVDVFGSELTGLSLTLGRNYQHTYYFAVGHADTANCTLEQVESVLKLVNQNCRFVIHNVNFELPVIHNTFGWFLRDVDDTKLMASYVDENESLGLKQNSKRWLDYEQQSYESTVADPVTGRRRKMDELTLAEVLSYGADDTIATAGLYNWFHLHMLLENVWQTYRDVEIGAAYWVAQAFLDGVGISQTVLQDMIKRDAKAKAEEEKILDDYLIAQGWEGTKLEEAKDDTYQTPAWIKYAFQIVSGEELKTAVRRFERLVHEVRVQGQETLADLLEAGDLGRLNDYLRSKFDGRPQFNVGSPKQMQHLLYEVMGLPIRLCNKPTDRMRQMRQEGNPQTDELAIQSALHYDMKENDERVAPLKALLNIKTYTTREGLFYKDYPLLPHWKDDKIHASLNQCSTVTRRFSCSGPNLQQIPKGAGDFRRIFVPHHKDALIVSLDFSAQELRLIADYSQDENLMSCYVGDNLRDMHSLTGAGIAKMPYEQFKAAVDDENHPDHKKCKAFRAIGKTVNFASSYGVAAPKLAQTLMVTEDEAQAYLDAKYAAFAGVEDWKRKIEAEARENGYVTTMLGARRHLTNIHSSDKWLAAKAERQAGNFCIQGSGAEMTKLAMGRMWRSKLRERYDIRFFAPIHDETVFSIAIEDIPQAVPEIHRYMTEQYADMGVPVESSVSLGLNFGDQHELNAVPMVENLIALVDKIVN